MNQNVYGRVACVLQRCKCTVSAVKYKVANCDDNTVQYTYRSQSVQDLELVFANRCSANSDLKLNKVSDLDLAWINCTNVG